MYDKNKTIVIVLTEQGYYSVFDGDILKEHGVKDGSPLLTFQSACPKYQVVEITKAVKFNKMLETVASFFKSQVKKVKDQVKPKVVRQQLPIMPMIAPLMITERSTVKSKQVEIMKTIKMNTEKVAANGKVATLNVVEAIFGTAHLLVQSTADLICYTEAQIINKLDVYDDTVEQLMAKRRQITSERQEIILKAPKTAKLYAEDHFAKLKLRKSQVKTA